MRIVGSCLIVLGFFLELGNAYSVFHTPFDHSKGTDYLIGEYLANLIIAIVGIILVIAGIKIIKNN